jgi:hypothetical protein
MKENLFRVGTYDSHGTLEVYKYFSDNNSAYEYFIDQRHSNDEVWIEKLTPSGEYETVEIYEEQN